MSDVDKWLERQTDHVREALENASRYFDANDSLDVHTLEAIYGAESSFGEDKRSRGMRGAAGHFMLEKPTGQRYDLEIGKGNDQRFDVDDSSGAAARCLKDIDDHFRNGDILEGNLGPHPVSDADERALFDSAAYNAGEAAIARAQQACAAEGKDPTSWEDVRNCLEAGGMKPSKADETRDYVDKVQQYRDEFARKSAADKSAKNKEPKKPKKSSKEGAFITLPDGRKVRIDK